VRCARNRRLIADTKRGDILSLDIGELLSTRARQPGHIGLANLRHASCQSMVCVSCASAQRRVRAQPHKKDVVYLVVMGNVFAHNFELEERYDLKGSTLGRRVAPEKRNKDSVCALSACVRDRVVCAGVEGSRLSRQQTSHSIRTRQDKAILESSARACMRERERERGDLLLTHRDSCASMRRSSRRRTSWTTGA
jgi:hypothetical protein